jgi:hypothetical protein
MKPSIASWMAFGLVRRAGFKNPLSMSESICVSCNTTRKHLRPLRRRIRETRIRSATVGDDVLLVLVLIVGPIRSALPAVPRATQSGSNRGISPLPMASDAQSPPPYRAAQVASGTRYTWDNRGDIVLIPHAPRSHWRDPAPHVGSNSRDDLIASDNPYSRKQFPLP